MTNNDVWVLVGIIVLEGVWFTAIMVWVMMILALMFRLVIDA